MSATLSGCVSHWHSLLLCISVFLRACVCLSLFLSLSLSDFLDICACVCVTVSHPLPGSLALIVRVGREGGA